MKSSLPFCLALIFAVLLIPTLAQERPTEKAGKGIELYSWKDSDGDWLFAVVPGTNRRRPEADIKRKENQISGVRELEKHFLRLALGEQVFWLHQDQKGFAYPDEKMVAAVASAARNAKVELHVPAKDKKNG